MLASCSLPDFSCSQCSETQHWSAATSKASTRACLEILQTCRRGCLLAQSAGSLALLMCRPIFRFQFRSASLSLCLCRCSMFLFHSKNPRPISSSSATLHHAAPRITTGSNPTTPLPSRPTSASHYHPRPW